MKLTMNEVNRLLGEIVRLQSDPLDCDGCSALFAECAEAEIHGTPVSEATKAIESHLSQCVCCRWEYATLLVALRAETESSAAARDMH